MEFAFDPFLRDQFVEPGRGSRTGAGCGCDITEFESAIGQSGEQSLEIGGLFAALAALTYTSLISSGDPTQGTTYTLIAVTALVLGGASLAGGRGGVMGSLLGAVNIYLITYVLATFNFGPVQSFVTDLAYGAILVLSLLLTVVLPHVRGVVRSISPLLDAGSVGANRIATAECSRGITRVNRMPLHRVHGIGLRRGCGIGTRPSVNAHTVHAFIARSSPPRS